MEKTFNRMAEAVAHATGRPWAFALCVASVVIWALTGPIFHYSETWQLVINTGTTIITFLMVFLIQNTQNRDGAAIQAKLDELIRSGHGKNDLLGLSISRRRRWSSFAPSARRPRRQSQTAPASLLASIRPARSRPRLSMFLSSALMSAGEASLSPERRHGLYPERRFFSLSFACIAEVSP
jgi:low affinity Fe/Cu permease